MRSVPWSVRVAALASLGSVVALLACTTDYQTGLDDPAFGAPNALAGQKQPGSSTEQTTGKGSGEGGASSSGGTQAACVAAGGTLLADAGACAVSFKTDVLGAFGKSTPQCSLPSCHGGASPQYPPRIDPGDPASMYPELAAFKLSNGKPYLNPCSTDPAASSLECNLAAAGGCGTHMPQGGQLAAEDLTKIDTWVKCGAPNN
jgi:hypothetical protein